MVEEVEVVDSLVLRTLLVDSLRWLKKLVSAKKEKNLREKRVVSGEW